MQLSWLKNKNIISIGGNVLYFMFIFIILLDPTNSIFHMKDVLFILLVGYNCLFYKPDFSYLPHICLVYGVVLLCSVFSDMQGCRIDDDILMATMKGFALLFLLLWTPYYQVIKLSKWPVILVSLLAAVLYIAVSSNELIEYFVWSFVDSHNDMIMMTRRNILGFKVFGMYYKSMVGFIFVLYLVYYQLYNTEKHRMGYLIAAIILTFTFFVSGTRVTMLLPFVLMGIVMLCNMQKWPKLRYFLYPVLCLCVIGALVLIFMLATQKGDESNAIKYGHLTSYLHLFDSNPFFLLFGQGPGALFYSIGFKEWTAQTEWTYIELIRNYGIFSIGILFVLFLPVYKLLKYRKEGMPFGILCTYIVYLFIAGTNPLLINSTGMIVLLSVYSYVHQVEHQHRESIPDAHEPSRRNENGPDGSMEYNP